MAISRAQMRTQLKGNKMKKTTKKKGGGKLDGLVGGALGAMMAGDIKGAIPGLAGVAMQRKMNRDEDDKPKSNMAAKPMKKGGAVKGNRGDGCCMRGKTKGTMR